MYHKKWLVVSVIKESSRRFSKTSGFGTNDLKSCMLVQILEKLTKFFGIIFENVATENGFVAALLSDGNKKLLAGMQTAQWDLEKEGNYHF